MAVEALLLVMTLFEQELCSPFCTEMRMLMALFEQELCSPVCTEMIRPDRA